MQRITLLTFIAILVCSLGQHNLYAAEYQLKFSHFWPATSDLNTKVFESWANAVETESKGQIKIDMYPSQTLTKASKSYDAVVNGIADITATAQGYTADRFPLTQIVELPGVTNTSAHGSCVLQSLYDDGLIKNEYQESQVLFMFTHGPGHIHSRTKLIKTPEDFSGLKVRQPTAVVGELLKGLGAQPVGMPAPQAYHSLQRGVIDAAAMPWEGAFVFRLNELTKYHTEITGGLYTLAFVVTMNTSVYQSLPGNLQQVIDNNSGMIWSQRTAKIFDELDKTARQDAVQSNHTTFIVEAGIKDPNWNPILQKATDHYLASLENKGMPANKVYQRALELSSECQ